ncbi:MAG: hypothetical protein R3288_16290 [Woeseiaceae bacterium]|nr:hypothetical protein [Woeseiaceae bacterium]
MTVSGADALTFLQGQLTNDLSELGNGPPMLAAWCNPKGRVICLFRVSAYDEGYRMALPTELVESVEKRLTMFRFRSKVDFERGEATATDLGATGTIPDWRVANLRAGIPDIRVAQSEAFTPHMLNLDLLGAISFDKGCYTGQEIVARTHYRGATKRRMFRFESEQPVAEGAEVRDGERKIGDVVNVIGNDLLAVIPVDSRDAGLSVDGTTLRRTALPYESKQIPVRSSSTR